MKIDDKTGGNLALGIGVGLCLGVALGSYLDNLALWLPLGLCFGVAIGLLYAQAK